MSLLLASFGLASRADEFAEETARTEKIFQGAHARYLASSNDVNTALEFGRACFDRAEFATNDTQRASLAEQGIAACQQAIARKYSSGSAHYYLAMNLGQLARTKSVGALRLVREMESEFNVAIGLDEKVNYAGPHRSLGELYKNAPGWPTSIGSRNKARQHLRRAAELCPDFPENAIALAEAYLDWGEVKVVVEGLPALTVALDKARTQFQGEQWSFDWHDWDTRVQTLKTKTGTTTKRTVSPRGQRG